MEASANQQLPPPTQQATLDTARPKLIRNEQMKLRANAFDRASTAFLAVGVLGPTVGGQPNYAILFWVGMAIISHASAHFTLRNLRP